MTKYSYYSSDFTGIFLLLLVLFIFNSLYIFFTRFERTITVDEKYTHGSRKNYYQKLSDTDGNIYVVKNSIIMMHWTSMELFNKLDIGKQFRISGYGVRIPFLGIIPNITSAVEIK